MIISLYKQQIGRFNALAAVGLIAVLLLALAATVIDGSSSAAQITNRKVTLSNSAGAATGVSYTLSSSALPTTATAVKSMEAQACTTASGACSTPSGFSASSSTLASQPTGLGCAAGWTVNAATAGSLRIVNAGCASTPSGAVSTQWNGVANATAQNATYYLRVTTYSDAAWTTPLDSGVVAVSTAQALTLSGTMDETLVFCAGTSITGTDCGTISGSSINFGNFSSTSTSSGTSVMAASTNGGSGYAITVNGTTLTCAACAGTPTIAALASQTASSTGSAQYGLNLRDNATPNVGANPSGSGSGTYTANYGTADQYRFVTGDSVATAAGSTNANAYTASYVVNVPGNQAAGTYSAVMTYIATATF